MIETKVFSNLDEALQMYASLGDKLQPEMSMALNRTTRGIRTDVTRQIVRTRGIKRSEVKDWKFLNARPGDMEAMAVIAGRGLPAESFFPNPSTLMEGRTTGGVTVKLAGGLEQLRHAFMGHVYTEELQVLQRKRGAKLKQDFYIKNGKRKRLKGRFPLNRIFFKSVPQTADDDDVVDVVITNAKGRILAQFDHVVDRLVKEYA